MFTGIVTAVGNIASVTPTAGGVRIAVAAGDLNLSDGQIGESIAVDGVCLTAVEISRVGFSADVSADGPLARSGRNSDSLLGACRRNPSPCFDKLSTNGFSNPYCRSP